MPVLRPMLVGIALALRIWAAGAVSQAPSYTAAGIVNSASYSADALAPNTIASLYGINLSFNTVPLTPSNMSAGGLPRSLGGVSVYVANTRAGLYYVSPTQINFLIPEEVLPVPVPVWVSRESVAGPVVTILLQNAGPGLFQMPDHSAIAVHLDYSLLDDTHPGVRGEVVVVFATGLGETIPQALNYTGANGIAWLADKLSFSILLDGVATPPLSILYAGLAPGFAGLYQVNFQIPDTAGHDPEIQLEASGILSVANVRIPVK